VGVGVGVGVADGEGVGDELVAAGTTLGVGTVGGVAALLHPAASTAANASTASLREITDCQHSVTPRGPARGDAWQQALDILQELDHPDADQLRAKLAG
jgi:hypothetical protein